MQGGMSIATGDSPLSEEIELFIVQLLIIVVLSKLLAYLLRFIKRMHKIVYTQNDLSIFFFNMSVTPLLTIFQNHKLLQRLYAGLY